MKKCRRKHFLENYLATQFHCIFQSLKKMWTVFACHILLGFTYDYKNNHCFFSGSFITSTCPAPLDYKHMGKMILLFTPAASTVCTAWQAAPRSASMRYASSSPFPVIGKKSVTKTPKPLVSLFFPRFSPITPIETTCIP